MAAPSLGDIADLQVYVHSEAGTSDPAQWDDQSGNARHLTQSTAGLRPALTAGVFMFGRVPGYRHTSSGGHYWNIPTAVFSGATAGTAMIVHKVDTYPGGGGGFWQLGADASNDHHPWIDGTFYDTTGVSGGQRKALGNPGMGTNAWTYCVSVATNDFKAYRNGEQFFSTGTVTVGWDAAPRLGNGTYLSIDGYIAAFAFWSRQLSGAEILDASDRFKAWAVWDPSLDVATARRHEPGVSTTQPMYVPSAGGVYVAADGLIKSPYGSASRGRSRTDVSTGSFRANNISATSTGRSPAGPLALPDSGGTVVWYRMWAWDVNAGVERTWDVSNSPDYNASRYTGAFGGGSINFRDVFILLRYVK